MLKDVSKPDLALMLVEVEDATKRVMKLERALWDLSDSCKELLNNEVYDELQYLSSLQCHIKNAMEGYDDNV